MGRLPTTAATAFTAVALLVAPAVTAAPAEAQTYQLVANQGWRVRSSKGNCTIGHNEPARGLSYTAAHCANPGEAVYLTDASGNVYPEPAGVFIPSQRYDETTYSNDWAAIRWNPGVRVQPNQFGGGYINAEALAAGETVCFHGFTTHSSGNGATCGRFVGVAGSAVLFDAPVASRPGDSGGPVFVPGKGVIGVVSGEHTVTGQFGERKLSRAAMLKDGRVVPTAEIWDIVSAYHGVPSVNRPPVTPQPATQASGSSATLGIIAAVVSLLAVLVPLLGSVLGR